MTAGIVMFDGTDPSQFPAAPAAVAGYVAGRWPDFRTLTAMFPHARALSIAVSADQDAEALDVETGDAAPGDVPGWHARQAARGVQRPAVYASVSVMQAEVIPVLKAAGIERSSVRIWTAHYAGVHICAPASCGELSIEADGTQHSDHAFGRDLDQSLLLGDFFATPAPPKPPVPSPVPAWQEAMMQALPVISVTQNNDDAHLSHWLIRRIQVVCNDIFGVSPQITVDGLYGPATEAGVKQVQQHEGLTADGVVGEKTWPVIWGVS